MARAMLRFQEGLVTTSHLGGHMASTWQPEPTALSHVAGTALSGVDETNDPRPPIRERRQRHRGGPECEPHRTELVSMIVGAYREMPGLSLHLPQAARLFGLRRITCEVVLDDLVHRGELRRAHDGQYILP
jgi:hypothetical protein